MQYEDIIKKYAILPSRTLSGYGDNYYVSSGQCALNWDIKDGGSQILLNGAIAKGTTLSGYAYVRPNGDYYGHYYFAVQEVRPGAIAYDTDIKSGCE